MDTLITSGPCYLCGYPAKYTYCGLHRNGGNAWLARRFDPQIRTVEMEFLRSGRTYKRRNVRAMLSFLCTECYDHLVYRTWPEALKVQRAAAAARKQKAAH